MHFILGSGISGLLSAQALKARGHRFLILDREHKENSSGNDGGFFYSHTKNPFTFERPFKIKTSSCPGSTPEGYKRKIYGDSPIVGKAPSIEKFGNNVLEGWAYDIRLLMRGLESKHFMHNEEVYSLSLKHSTLWTLSGKSFQFSRLISTIPLAYLVRMCADKQTVENPKFWEGLKFNSRPIYLDQYQSHTAAYFVGAPKQMDVVYCGSSCHKWYRQTIRFWNSGTKTETREFMESQNNPKQMKLSPGKIWNASQKEVDSNLKVLDLLFHAGIVGLGRYGAWLPAELTSDVWNRLKGLYGLD